MAEQQGNRDPNRIDVSLNMVSDTGLQAVEKLTAQLSALYGFVQSQTEESSAARIAGMANVAGRMAGAQMGTGVSHAMSPGAATWMQSPLGLYYPGMTPGATSAGTSTNPSLNDQTQRARRSRQDARDNFTAYRTYVESGSPPTADSPSLSPAGAQYAGHMTDWDLYKLARAEVRTGHIDRSRPQYSGNRLVAGLDRFFELRHPAQTHEDRTYEYVSGEDPLGGGYGGGRGSGGGFGGGTPPPSGSPGGPPGTPDPRLPAWYRGLQRAGINPDDRPSFTIPRFGEFTWQDRMGMAAEYLGARAMSRADEQIAEGRAAGLSPDQIDVGQGTIGRLANYAQYARENAAAFTMVNRLRSRVMNYGHEMGTGAEAQGFSREGSGLSGNVDIMGVGFRSPFAGTLGALFGGGSEAAKEGLHQEITRRRVSFAPGVSGEEAERIMRETAALGYSGNLNESLQMDVFRRLQQRGISPEEAAPLVDQAIRQGNNNLKDVRDTIIDLGNAARAAHMSLADATRSTQEYTNTMSSMGGRIGPSQQAAAGFMRSGIDPTIISGAMQNPFVQGTGVMITGMPGMMQGTLGQAGQSQIVARALDQALAIARPFANRGGTSVRLPNGQLIQTGNARDNQIAYASHLTGINQEFIARYMRNPRILTQAPTATAALQAFGGEVRALQGTPSDHEAHDYASTNPRVHAAQHVRDHRDSNQDIRDARLRAIGGTGSASNNRIEWGDVESQLLALDPDTGWQNRVRNLRKTGDLSDRLHKANEMVSKLTQSDPTNAPDQLIGLTPEARKFFHIQGNRDKRNAPRAQANAGGPNVNASRLGPGYDNPGVTIDPRTLGIPGG